MRVIVTCTGPQLVQLAWSLGLTEQSSCSSCTAHSLWDTLPRVLLCWAKTQPRLPSSSPLQIILFLIPSLTMTKVLPPLLFLPVLPIHCTSLMGLLWASKPTIRSTSPMSSPSSPLHVARCCSLLMEVAHHLNVREKNNYYSDNSFACSCISKYSEGPQAWTNKLCCWYPKRAFHSH